ncbi:hypothetical protein ACFQWB_12710 [Paenibacillus thermoaerophilus]|uniref:Flp pilus-assembly TadE/G-like n=1 Tax=Paenibacillus thermoaerophilus TaxID=1215385 RepID=A0ABW2V3Q4_9BACL|nr:hypothetical protein [Paenibacillus thermoaerophilus]TMV17149.1 hypothetical protein FE781_08210 [Paenibacillus thermoaerophilus]
MNKRLREADERGSVSVYGVIAVFGLLVLMGVLIDTVRIQLAGMQSERALKTALRSALASFDTGLQQYGLFATTEPKASIQAEAADTMKRNLSGHVSGKSVIDTRLEKFGTIAARYPLADHDIFKRQILETMKYRAPIEFARSVVEPFAGLSDALAAAQTFQNTTDTLENRLQEREKLLDDAWEQTMELQKTARLAEQNAAATESELEAISNRIRQAQEERASIGFPTDPEQAAEAARARQALDAEIAALAEASNRSRRNGIETALRSKQDMEARRQAVREAVEAARSKEGEMEQLASKARENPKLASIGAQDAFVQLPLHGTDYYDSYLSGVDAAVLRMTSLDPGASWEQCRAAAEGARSDADRFVAGRQRTEEERKRQTAEAKRKTNEAKEKGKAVQEEVRKAHQSGCSKTDHPLFLKLAAPGSGLFAKYVQYNEQMEADRKNKDPLEAAPESGVRETLAHANRMESFLLSLRDELYVNEYALTYFNYRTIGFDLASDKAERLSAPDTHRLEKQEAEYILYGAPSCHLNVHAAYGEIFLFRTAIRTAEALADPKVRAAGAGSPILMFAAALLQGLEKAKPDTDDLIAGKSVPLGGEWVNVPWTYKDHLRLFYLFHSGDVGVLSRMQALIELNESTDLTKAYTYIQGDATTSVKPWFLPQAAKALQNGWIGGKLSDGRLQLQRSAHLSYH